MAKNLSALYIESFVEHNKCIQATINVIMDGIVQSTHPSRQYVRHSCKRHYKSW